MIEPTEGQGVEAAQQAVEQSPNADAPASDQSNIASTTATDVLSAGSTTGASELSGSNPVSDKATPSDFVSEINPSNALAATSGKLAGKNNTGMAAGAAIDKATPAASMTIGDNAGVDTSNVNIAASNVPHPIVSLVTGQVAELRMIVSNVHKQTPTPFLERALKDLQTFEEWVVQHYEELKRKL